MTRINGKNIHNTNAMPSQKFKSNSIVTSDPMDMRPAIKNTPGIPTRIKAKTKANLRAITELKKIKLVLQIREIKNSC